jgi:hypothetical protein
VQDRVVTVLKEALQIGGGPVGQARILSAGAASLDAFEHYSLGRQCLYQMGRDSLAQAKQHFEKAIAMDENYALAHAAFGRAVSLALLHPLPAGQARKGFGGGRARSEEATGPRVSSLLSLDRDGMAIEVGLGTYQKARLWHGKWKAHRPLRIDS